MPLSPSTQKTKERGRWTSKQPGLYNETQARQGHKVTVCHQKKKKKKKKKGKNKLKNELYVLSQGTL
jgi:hypothetical protein